MREAPGASSITDQIYASKTYKVLGLFGLLGALISLALAFPPLQRAVFGTSPKLAIRVDQKIAAFDVRRSLPGLSVNYNGRDLTAENAGLVLTSVALTNDGTESITSKIIPASDPIGFEVRNAKIIGLVSYRASTQHLQTKAVPKQIGNSFKLFGDFVIDPGDRVMLDFLSIKKNDQSLHLASMGKVVGQKEIRVLDNGVDQGFENPFTKATRGNFLIQIIRLVLYTLISIALLLFLIFLMESFGSLRKSHRKSRRATICSSVKPLFPNVDGNVWMLIASTYETYGTSGLRIIHRGLAQKHFSDAFDDAIGAVEAPERKPNETEARYIKRAFAKNVSEFDLLSFLRRVAANIGLDITAEENRLVLRELAEKFERRADEAAAEKGFTASAIEERGLILSQSLVRELPVNLDVRVTDDAADQTVKDIERGE